MSAAFLLPATLLFPLVAALVAAFARRADDARVADWSRAMAWAYAVLATATAATALATEGGLVLPGPSLDLGASGFEFAPALYLDGRGAAFVLLLGLTPALVLTLLRAAVSGPGARGQAAWGWLLVFGLAGVFLVDSLLLFYVFWEAALVAVYFWIGRHGARNRFGGAVYGALLRFVLFTLAGSLPMLASIAAACAVDFRDPGLLGLPAAMAQLPDATRAWVFLGFFLGFAVKLPLLGFHGWLRDTYNVAPPACRALLSAAMSKMGAYGLLLVLAPAFPHELSRFAPALLVLAVAGAVYGGVLMLAQDRLLDLLAYASLSHLSILAAGVFASAVSASAPGADTLVTTGLTGAAWLALNHALIMAVLFALDARVLRRGSVDGGLVSGLRARQPRLFAFLLLAVLASASLPGLNNFPGEILVLLAAYAVNPWAALFLLIAALTGAAALVRLLHAAWLGLPGGDDDARNEPSSDLGRGDAALLAIVSAAWIALGLYPMLLLGPIERAFAWLAAIASTGLAG